MTRVDKQELIGLLGNCIIACALSNDPDVIREAREAAEIHVKKLDEHFPGWKEALEQDSNA